MLLDVNNVLSGATQRLRRQQWPCVLILLLSDALFAIAVWWGVARLAPLWEGPDVARVSFGDGLPYVVMWTVAYLGLRALLGLYPGYGLAQEEKLRRQTYSTAGALVLAAGFNLAAPVEVTLPHSLVALGFLLLLVVAPIIRYFTKLGMMRFGLWGKPVVILGTSDGDGERLEHILESEWGLGLVPAGTIEVSPDFWVRKQSGGSLHREIYGETVEEVLDEIRQWRTDTIVIDVPPGRPGARPELLNELVNEAGHRFRNVIVKPEMSGTTTSAVVARDFGGMLAIEVKHNLLNPWALRAKRVLDLGATVVIGALTLPFFLVLSLLVYLELRGPIFYKDRRMGQDGRLFLCIKFRTMVPGAEELLLRMLEEDAQLREEYLKYHKLRNDPRVTRVGRFLRKTSLDELPQLWNVLKGEMSLVGPRPYLPRESEKIGSIQSDILRVPPGITGPWQVSGRNTTSFSERVALDAHYVRKWSVWLDLVILARTVQAVILGRGAS